MQVDDEVVQLVVISGAGQCEAGDDMKGRGYPTTAPDQGHKKVKQALYGDCCGCVNSFISKQKFYVLPDPISPNLLRIL